MTLRNLSAYLLASNEASSPDAGATAQIDGNLLLRLRSPFRVCGVINLLFSLDRMHASGLDFPSSSKFVSTSLRIMNKHRPTLFRLKAILFVLLKAFEFELAVPPEDFYDGVR